MPSAKGHTSDDTGDNIACSNPVTFMAISSDVQIRIMISFCNQANRQGYRKSPL